MIQFKKIITTLTESLQENTEINYSETESILHNLEEFIKSYSVDIDTFLFELSPLFDTKNIYKKIYLYSFIITVFNSETYAKEFITFLISCDELSPEQKFYLYNQLKAKLFIGVIPNTLNINILLYELLENCCIKMEKKIQTPLRSIPVQNRNKNFILMLTDQFISIEHGPTKSALGRCMVLQNLGKQVLLLNTAENLTISHFVPFFNSVCGNYTRELSSANLIEWKEYHIPYCQCDQVTPDIETYEYLLQTIINLKPYYVISIGGDGLFTSLVNKLIPVLSIGMVPSSINPCLTAYQTLGRPLNPNDRAYLNATAKCERQIIVHKFTSDIVEQCGFVTRTELNIAQNDFVLVLVGGRLSAELTSEFFEILDAINEITPITIVILGEYNKEEELQQQYPNLASQIKNLGFQSDILAYLEICDLYVNPIRTGGGTSCVEAMSKGLPVVTTPYGDVAVNAGDDFITENYDTMKDLIIKYKNDKIFYQNQSELAKKRAEELLDTDGAFKEVLREFCNREGLEFN